MNARAPKQTEENKRPFSLNPQLSELHARESRRPQTNPSAESWMTTAWTWRYERGRSYLVRFEWIKFKKTFLPLAVAVSFLLSFLFFL